MQYGIVCGGGGLRRQAENLKEMRCSCVSMCYYLAPYHFANV